MTNDTISTPTPLPWRDRNELSLWRESLKANIACRNAIEEHHPSEFRRNASEQGLPHAGAGRIRL